MSAYGSAAKDKNTGVGLLIAFTAHAMYRRRIDERRKA